MTGQRADGLLKPCGTPAGHKRHYRRGEKPCWSCMNAELERQGKAPASAGTADNREPARNGLPVVLYRWRARSYPWAQRALAASIARYGNPQDPPDYDEIALLDDLLATGYARPARSEGTTS